MNDSSRSPKLPSRRSTVGDSIRAIADKLQDSTDRQIEATARIMSAAAKIAVNHDRLIDDVVDMVSDDLTSVEKPAKLQSTVPYTIDALKQQFGSFREAKRHFGLKATGWNALLEHLNGTKNSTEMPFTVLQCLATIEEQIEHLQNRLKRLEQKLDEVLHP